MNRHHSRPDIVRLLERRARRGMTFRELSEESGIPIPTLSYWAAKLRRDAEDELQSKFVPVEIVDDDRSGAIVIEIGSAVRVTVERGFDEAHLSRVLSVLSRC